MDLTRDATADAPIGVLAIQGDYAEHERALARCGFATRRVRRAADLTGLTGLVLPGGESTTMLKLAGITGLEEPLAAAVGSGLPVLATCAGLILLARRVVDPEQRSFGVLDCAVSRNGYGRQLHSGTFPLVTGGAAGLPDPMSGVFIRAPRIFEVGPAVEVLARRGADPVLIRQGNVLGACFHPEIERDHPVLALFAAMVRGERSVLSDSATVGAGEAPA